jgi:glc operon protein GlcG
MTPDRFHHILSSLDTALERHMPEFLADPEDLAIAQGNLVFAAISDDGHVFGRFWGTDPVRQRGSAQVAWAKANQVKLTRAATGAYERDVWAGRKNWWEFGIPLPEFIGWEGGLPAILEDGTFVALALSGLRQDKDCALLARAVAETDGIALVSAD